MKSDEVAWAAGFYEGEGCIHFDGKNLNMTLSQCNREPLDRYYEIMGCGKIYGPYTKRRVQPIYTWKVSGRSAVEAIGRLSEWLSKRRTEQAQTAIEAYERRPKKPPRRTREQIRQYNTEWARRKRLSLTG